MGDDVSVSGKRTSFVTFLLVAQICGAALCAPASHAQTPQAMARQTPAATLAPGSFKAYAAEGVASRVSDFSGLAVPRYSSLRYDKVNGRAGPSPDYPVTWTYERQGLPVVIVRESQEWRKIRDPQGDEVWVHRRMLSADRTAITTVAGAIKHEADSRSQPIARFNIGAVLKLEACTPAWCQVEAEGRKGFVLKSQLWGVDALPPAPK
jgi:SH3-like domain-containing protein